MLRTRRVFLNGSPGLEFPGYRPPANAEYVGPLVPARRAISPRAALPDVVLLPSTRSWRSPKDVDNTDPGKLIVPTIEALKDSARTWSSRRRRAPTEALRARYPQPNVVIEDFINYDDLFPHVDVFVTSGGFGSNLAAFCTASRSWARASARARTTSTPGSATTSSASTCAANTRSAAIRKAVHASSTTRSTPTTSSKVRAELQGLRPDSHDREHHPERDGATLH